MSKIFTFLLIFFLPLMLFGQNTKKVLVIGIDGCRSDALAAANTPNIDNLINNGIFSPDALNDDVTISGPGWSAILCGVLSDKHLVTNNDFSGNNYENYPPFFKYLEDINPDLNTVSICHWAPINDHIVQGFADEKVSVGTDLEVATQAINFLTLTEPDVVFLHFDDVDHAGHGSGFSIGNSNYIAAIEGADLYVGAVMEAVEQRTNFENEDWLIMVTTDHGGIGTSHGGNSFEERNVFMVVSGNNIPTEVILADSSIVFDEPENCLGDSIELRFDGNDDYVQIPSDPVFDFGMEKDFTVECRVRTNQAADVAIIGNKDWDSGANPGFVFSFKFASGPEWKVNIGDGTNRADLNTGGEIANNEWYTLSVSFDRDGMMKMYQDGEILDSIDISLIGDITTNQGLFFGTDFNTAYDFTGAIAEVRVWNKVLTESVISDWSCNSVDNFHPEFPTLIGYWRMNEGNATTEVIDLAPSGNGNNGTIHGATWGSPDSMVIYDYAATPRLTDIMPTLFTHLCIPIEPSWELDGTSLIPNCVTTNLIDQTIAIKPTLEIFPNPAQKEVNILLKNIQFNHPVQLEIYTSTGKMRQEVSILNEESTFDITNFQKGLYFFTIKTNNGDRITKKVVIYTQ